MVEDGGCCGIDLPTPVDDVGLTSVEDVAVRRFADVQKEDLRQECCRIINDNP